MGVGVGLEEIATWVLPVLLGGAMGGERCFWSGMVVVTVAIVEVDLVESRRSL